MRLEILCASAGVLALALACSSSTTNEAAGGSDAGGSSSGGTGSGGTSSGGAGGASGGAAGNAGTGGAQTDGAAGAGGSGGSAFCPTTKKGPALVQVETSFCIDATEVTNGQYAEFLASVGDAGVNKTDQSACDTITDYAPKDNTQVSGCPAFSAQTDKTFPVRCVDWCSAYAYCQWAGKRLCGKTLGGPAAPTDATSSSNQWFAACAGPGGKDKYGYGDSYVDGLCADKSIGVVQAVASYDGCVSHWYKPLKDMVGNVSEWENACDSPQAVDAGCNHRGGSAFTADAVVNCTNATKLLRTSTSPDIGFRCCWDPSLK